MLHEVHDFDTTSHGILSCFGLKIYIQMKPNIHEFMPFKDKSFPNRRLYRGARQICEGNVESCNMTVK